MKTKKIISTLVLALCVLCAMVFTAACGEAKVQQIYIEQSSVTLRVAHNSVWNTDGIKIKAKLSNGKETEILSDECEFSNIDTSTVGKQTLTVTYGSYTAQIDIEIYKTVSTFAIKAGSILTTVDHNGALSTSGAILVLTYSDGTTEEITQGFSISQPDTTTVGTKQLTITYDNQTINFSYQVIKTLSSITINQPYTNKVAYGVAYNTGAITVKATYSDGSFENIANSALSFSSIDTNTVGDQTLTITYLTKTTTVTINVYAELQSIAYKSGLTALIKYGTNLDTSALTVTGTYSDNTTPDITAGLQISGFNNQILGNQTLTITHSSSGKTTTFVIEVYEEFEELRTEAANPSDLTTSYVLLGEDVDLSKFKVYAVYTKNEVLLNNNNVTFSEISTDTIGEKEIEVSYTNANNITKNTTINITVIENWDDIPTVSVTAISIVASTVSNTINHNATLDLSGLTIRVTYSNGLTANLLYEDFKDLEEADKMTATFSSATVGSQNLTVTYKTKSATLAINVAKVLMSISVQENTAISSLKYGEELDLSGVIILAHYSDDSSQDISDSASNNATLFDNTILETQTITFGYNSKNCTMDIEVYEEIEELVDVQGVVMTVEYGTAYSTANIVAKIEYTSGRKVQLTNANLTFSTINTNIVGSQNLVITYQLGDKTITKTISINVYDVVVSIIIKADSVASEVYVGDTLSTANLAITLTYKSGVTSNIQQDFTINPFSTQQIGTFDLVVQYGDLQASKAIEVKKDYQILGYSEPNFVTSFKSNSILQNTYNTTNSAGQKGFTDINNEYKVGDDNAFMFAPVMQVKMLKTNQTTTITNFELSIKVYLYDETELEWQLLTDPSTYVSINSINHTLQFVAATAKNKKFKIEVLPKYMTAAEAEIVDEIIFIFRVIDGYNAYNAADISLVDNVNSAGKWTEYKNEKGISLNAEINAIILHNDISITDADVPAIHFYTAEELNAGDKDYGRALGSLKDYSDLPYGYIYYRSIGSGQSFTFEGNYFQLSAQDLSLIVRQEVNGIREPSDEDEAITVHTTLFAFFGNSSNAEMANYYINNIALYGNTQKSEDAALSGGVIFAKVDSCNATFYNNLSQRWFISYFFQGRSTYGDNCVFTMDKVNAYDAYTSIIYCWAVRDLQIDNSILIGAGGPIMICDHCDNDEQTGEGGTITNVTTTNSVLESHIVGTEGWFNTYKAGVFVTQIKMYDEIYKALGKTITMDADGTKINLISIFKSGAAQGPIASIIRGTFKDTGCEYGLNLHNNDTYLYMARQTGIYDAVLMQTWQGVYQGAYNQAIGGGATPEQAHAMATAYADEHVMEYFDENNVIAAIKNFTTQGIMQITDSGAVAFAGGNAEEHEDSFWMILPDVNFNGTPNQELLDATQKYLYLYLFNGMGAVIEIKDYTPA